MMQTSLHTTKVKKGVDQELELLEVSETRTNAQKQHQMKCQKGAGGQSSTVLCFPKGMQIVPAIPYHMTYRNSS